MPYKRVLSTSSRYAFSVAVSYTIVENQEVHRRFKCELDVSGGPSGIAVLRHDGTQKSGEGVGRHVQRAFVIIELDMPFRPI